MRKNAAADIISYGKHNEFREPQNYECQACAFVAGVVLKGKIANVE